MKIHPIITHNSLDNIFYILEYWQKQAIVIDPSDSNMCQQFLEQKSLLLEAIFITHEHSDHYSGVKWLQCDNVFAWKVASESIPLNIPNIFSDNDIVFDYQNIQIKGVFSPWHTFWHMMFELYQNWYLEAVFVWDVLFAWWVGNTYNWDTNILYKTIQRFKEYEDAVTIYSGHDYLRNNLNFVKKYFPEKKESCDSLLQEIGDEVYFTNMKEERDINLFLLATQEEFISLRELRNTH
jgi:hydroxyacylglutathione hydrolase